MIVKSSILFRDYSKISDQEFQLFSSMKISSVYLFVFYRIENLQKTFDLLSSIAAHAIDDQDMNKMLWIRISIINHARHEVQSHIKQNFNECFDFNRNDVVSWFWMRSDFDFLQLSLDIDVFNHDFKKSKTKK